MPTIQIGPDAVNSPISIQATDDVYVAPATPSGTSDSNDVSEPNGDAASVGATETAEVNEPTNN